MKYLFVLSGENLELAREEVLALADTRKYEEDGNVIIVDCKKFHFSRLAFCHKVLRFLFECSVKDVEKKVSSFDWEKVCRGAFCVRYKGNVKAEQSLAKPIWRSLKKPKVNLKNPDTKIDFIKSKKLYCGITLWENPREFSSRATKHKPGFHPSSMNPRLAMACVNLTGLKKGEKILDPFCGAGSILVEAGLMGLKALGNDIDFKMLRLAKKNLEHYKVKAVLTEKDALKLKIKVDGMVTDLPYGRASSLHKKKAAKLYNEFLEVAPQLLKKGRRLIMVIPSKAKVKHSMKEVARIDHYVHHALTRRIYVLEK